MNPKLKKWMPIALCCLPGVAVAAIIGVSLGGSTIGASLGEPLGIGLIVLAALACPLSMYLMMTRRRESSRIAALSSSQLMADCCGPGEEASTNHLAALRAQRESLEHELASMQRSI